MEECMFCGWSVDRTFYGRRNELMLNMTREIE